MAQMGNGTVKRGPKAGLGIGAALFIFMLAALLLMSRSLQNSALFDRYYAGLLLFNAAGLISLLILIGLNIKRLIRQFRARVAGSRMTLRMLLLFAVLSVTPVLIVYYFSLDFLHRGIDSWFDLRVEEALDDSLELSRLALDVRMRELLKTTEQTADELADIEPAGVVFEIDKTRARISADELTLMARNGAVIASSASDTGSLAPDSPGETVLLQLLQSGTYINLDLVKNRGLLIRVVVSLPAADIGQEPRLLQALFPISERMNQLAGSVQSAYIDYKELSYLREQLKISFIIILTLVLLFSILSAVWAAFYSAGKLAAPVKDLASGARAVAGGDYTIRLPVPGHDELGFLVASFNDMTDKIAEANHSAKESQRRAEAQRAYLETVLSCLTAGVMVFNRDGQLARANIAAAEILEAEFAGRDNLDSLAARYPRLAPLLKCISNNVEEGMDDWREQITLPDRAGGQILMINGATLTGAGGSGGAGRGHVIVLDEITALVKGQRDAARSEIARRLVHEIKNPLTPIQLAAERLRHKYLGAMDKKNAATLDRMTNTIVQQVATMKTLVNNFSEYARAPEFNPVEIRIEGLLSEALDLFGNLDSGNRISTRIEADLPAITGDEGKLRQVFNNLLSNAVEANRINHDNSLTVSAGSINVAGEAMIEIRIKDHGPGLGAGSAEEVFAPYVTGKPAGTGLGLAIVKRIIAEHKGQVWLENNPEGPGATAVVRLLAHKGAQYPIARTA